MTAKAKERQPWNPITGTDEVDGRLVVRYRTQVWRFLFDDGSVHDVECISAGSNEREEVLTVLKKNKIEGCVLLPLPAEPVAEPPAESNLPKAPAKRAAKRPSRPADRAISQRSA